MVTPVVIISLLLESLAAERVFSRALVARRGGVTGFRTNLQGRDQFGQNKNFLQMTALQFHSANMLNIAEVSSFARWA